jgi:hypothetical protein
LTHSKGFLNVLTVKLNFLTQKLEPKEMEGEKREGEGSEGFDC